MGKDESDIIIKHHRGLIPKARASIDFDPIDHGLSNGPEGLGDCILLSDCPFASPRPFPVHSNSPAWPAVEGLLKIGSGQYFERWIRADVAYKKYNLGNGHLFQRLRRLYGFPVDDKPSGKLDRKFPQIKGRVALHFDAGIHQSWQLKHVHKRARIVYPENKLAITKFIEENSQLEFVEFGGKWSGIEPKTSNYRSLVSIELGLQLRALSTCDFFIGIVSGFMHAAAAFEIPSIVILNFPVARKIILPTITDTELIESEWLYPQNIHLHQDNAGPLVPRFSLKNLKKAYNGEVYPYFKDDWLPLINEDTRKAANSFTGTDFDMGKPGKFPYTGKPKQVLVNGRRTNIDTLSN